MRGIPVALTIAGSDPSGGAGIQADLKTFHQLGVFGTAAITLIAVQNTVRVHRVSTLDAKLVGQQIDAVLEDIPPQAAKTGALGTAAIIEAVAARRLPCPLIVDPVMVSSHGAALLDENARAALKKLLLPKATLVTPNLDEAAILAGMKITDVPAMQKAAIRIAALGVPSVLIKGGHLEGDAIDVLFHDGQFLDFRTPRIVTRNTHGTGCTYSAAITAFVAQGLVVPEAVRLAKAFIQAAIEGAPGLGSGSGPLNHWV
jgi:hydroxymethylpyrimidine/phosphomethylpyrimidine kinase